MLKTIFSPERRRGFLLRVLPAGVIFLLAILLLSYSVYFFYFFQVHGSVTSYFPWRWGDYYHLSKSSVLKLFYIGLGLSLFFLIASGAVVFYFGRSLLREQPAPARSASDTSKASSISETQEIPGDLPTESTPPPEKVENPVEEKGIKTSAALRSRNRRKSRLGAVVMLVLSVNLLVISYRFPNIVVEVDSVVAFAAAIVLIYKDTTHSVQLRVVDRILDSSNQQVSQLAGLRFPAGRSLHSRVEGREGI